MIDSLSEIVFTLRRNKLRTFLTAFGVFWGILLLILLLGAGQGLQNGANAQFGSSAEDAVWIWSRKTSIPYKGLNTNRRIRFTQADVDAIKHDVSGIMRISATNLTGTALIKAGKKNGSFRVLGVADHYFAINNKLDFRSGRALNALDNAQLRKVAMIGTLVAERLFPGGDVVGKSIQINTIPFTVIGLFYDKGQRGRRSERIYIPLDLYQTVFNRGTSYISTIGYQPFPAFDTKKVEDDVVSLLKQRHRIAPEDKSAIRSFNMKTQMNQSRAMFAAITAFIWFVGVGTLTAGVVGVSNIMMITVKERTVEIGVRKALGARPINIVSSLLFESVLVTAVAGYIGLVFGVSILELVRFMLETLQIKNTYFQRPEVDFSIALQAIIILVLAGALAGLAPAWRAAKISPVEAMRAE